MTSISATLSPHAGRGKSTVCSRTRLDEAGEVLRPGVAGVDVAGIVDADAFQRTEGLGFLDEARDLAVLGAAEADALLEARIELVTGLGVGDVDLVFLVDPDSARAAELLPLGEELAVLVEDLDAAISAVGDEQASGGIHGETMRHVEFARALAFLAPRLDELAILGELDDAGVGLLA